MAFLIFPEEKPLFVTKTLNDHPLAELCECAIHLGLLDNPKLLPCGHSFCLTCLQTTHLTEVNKGHHSANQVKCPLCSSMHLLPTGAISDLPVDFKSKQLIEIIERELSPKDADKFVDVEETVTPQAKLEELRACFICKQEGRKVFGTTYCLTCKDMFCHDCNQRHNANTSQQDHVQLKVDLESFENIICKEHKMAFVSNYCITCRTPVCNVCTVRGNSSHKLAKFTNRNSSGYEFPQAQNDPSIKIKMSLTEKKNSLDQAVRTEDLDKITLLDKVDNHINRQIANLEEQRKKIHDKINAFYLDKRKTNDTLKTKIDSLVSQVDKLDIAYHNVNYPLGPNIPVGIDSHSPSEQLLDWCKQLEISENNVKVEQSTCQFRESSMPSVGELVINNTHELCSRILTSQYGDMSQEEFQEDPYAKYANKKDGKKKKSKNDT